MIYLDLDGVVADFRSHVNFTFSKDYSAYQEPMDDIENLKIKIPNFKAWWENIPPCKDAHLLVARLWLSARGLSIISTFPPIEF